MIAADRILRLAQIRRDLLALHHRRTPFGKHGLLAVLRRQRLQFLGCMAQIVRLARGAFHAGAVFGERCVGGAPRVPQLLQRCDVLLEPREGVEQAAVGRGIDQRALVMLAVNFHQRRADRFQGLYADRLVVDEGAGAAVGELHAAQDHLAVVLEPVVGKDGGGRMAFRHVEYRGDLPLLDAVTDQARIAAAAERQRKGIEQDGLARAGFAGQHR